MVNLIDILKSLVMGFITGLLISMPLGPSTIESINRTISKGFKEGFMVSLGAVSADMSYLLLINGGLLTFLNKNESSETLFWLISGCILVHIGYKYIVGSHIRLHFSLNYHNSTSFISGYIITFFNPMTLTLWIGVSGTIMRVWHHMGYLYYYSFIFSILAGMITWFFVLNLLALKGFKRLKTNRWSCISSFINYLTLILGILFIFYAIIRFVNFL